MAKLIRSVGNWVDGDRFWNQKQEVADFIEYLDEGAHLLLTAQRRIGKTSLMREVKRQIEDRYDCLFLDLEHCRAPEDLVIHLAEETKNHVNLWAKTKEVFSGVLDAVQSVEELNVHASGLGVKRRNGVNRAWMKKGDRLVAALADCNRPVVIFMDELPILVNRLSKGSDYSITPERTACTEEFMSWLRALSLRHQGTVRLVLTGSIGLEPVLRQVGLSATINNYTSFELGPWSHTVARGCLLALAEQYEIDFEEDALAAVIEQLGTCIPYHVQLYFDKINDDCRRRGVTTCRRADAIRVYGEAMLGSRSHPYLNHDVERLKMVLGPKRSEFAFDLLTQAALASELTGECAEEIAKRHMGESMDRRGTLQNILGILEHDGYLRKPDTSFIFESNLLRDWWSKRFGFGFKVAGKVK